MEGPGSPTSALASAIGELREEQTKLERDNEASLRALNLVAPTVTVNLQDIWKETLKPLQAHGTTLVNMHSQLVGQTERIDNIYVLLEEMNKKSERKFQNAEVKNNNTDAKLNRLIARVEQFDDWKNEILGELIKEKNEREDYQRLQNARMAEVEAEMRTKLNGIQQQVDNVEFDLQAERKKRESVEAASHEQKLAWDDQLNLVNNKLNEHVDRMSGLKQISSKLQDKLQGITSNIDRIALQIVALENKDLPENIRRLPSDVDSLKDQANDTHRMVTILNDFKQAMLMDLDELKKKNDTAVSTMNDHLNSSLKSSKEENEEIGIVLKNELYTKMEEFVGNVRQNLREMAEARRNEQEGFQAKIKYLLSPADMLNVLLHFDPLANNERSITEKTPVTPADLQSLFDKQKAQKTAAKRGNNIMTNMGELTDSVGQLQKMLMEVTMENETLNVKVGKLESEIKMEMMTAVESELDGLKRQVREMAVKLLVNENEEGLNKEKSEKAAGGPAVVAAGGASTRDLDFLKQRTRRLEETVAKMAAGGIQMPAAEATPTESPEAAMEREFAMKEFVGGEIRKVQETLKMLRDQVILKMDLEEMKNERRNLLDECLEMIKTNQVKLKLTQADMSAIGPIKSMLEDVMERMNANAGVMSEVRSGLNSKADAALVQMVSDELSNLRNLVDVREDALRTDLHSTTTTLNAEISFRLDESRVRDVVEQMLDMYRQFFVPAGSPSQSQHAPPPPPPPQSYKRPEPVKRTAEEKELIEELMAQVKSTQEQIIAVDTAMEKQSYAQTEVINLQLKKVVGELDGFRSVLDNLKLVLKEKASLKQLQELDALLREIIRQLLSGEAGGGNQVVLASRLGEAWRCLSCNKAPLHISELTGAPAYSQPFPRSPSPPSRSNSPSRAEEWRGDSAMSGDVRAQSPPPGFAQVDAQKGGMYRVRSRTAEPHLPRHLPALPAAPVGYIDQFRPSSTMPPTSFHQKNRDLSGEIQRASGVPSEGIRHKSAREVRPSSPGFQISIRPGTSSRP